MNDKPLRALKVLTLIIQQMNKRAILTAKHMKPQIARIRRIKECKSA